MSVYTILLATIMPIDTLFIFKGFRRSRNGAKSGPVPSQWLLFVLIVSIVISLSSATIKPGYLDFDNLPDTNFTCIGKVIGGYYADVETSCQMFHVCTISPLEEAMDIRFLCLNGTVFDQETRVCERVEEVDCSKTEKFYDLNLELYGNLQENQNENIIKSVMKSTTAGVGSTLTTTTTTTTTATKATTTTTTTTTERPITARSTTTAQPTRSSSASSIPITTRRPFIVSTLEPDVIFSNIGHYFKFDANEFRYKPDPESSLVMSHLPQLGKNRDRQKDLEPKLQTTTTTTTLKVDDDDNDDNDDDDDDDIDDTVPDSESESETFYSSTDKPGAFFYGLISSSLAPEAGKAISYQNQKFYKQYHYVSSTTTTSMTMAPLQPSPASLSQPHPHHLQPPPSPPPPPPPLATTVHSKTAKLSSVDTSTERTNAPFYLKSSPAPFSHRFSYHDQQKNNQQLTLISETSRPTPFRFGSRFDLDPVRRLPMKRNEIPRIIVNVDATVRDSNGRQLNYTIGTIVPADRTVTIGGTRPASRTFSSFHANFHDDHYDDETPFYYDVPKIQPKVQQHRRFRRKTMRFSDSFVRDSC